MQVGLGLPLRRYGNTSNNSTATLLFAGTGLTLLPNLPAGAGAYVFAKRSINSDRQARLEEQRKKRSMIESLEYTERNGMSPQQSSASAMGGSKPTEKPNNTDPVGSPGREQYDPAPTRHAPTTEGERVLEKSKYETSTPFRSRKGDRFSDL